MHHRSRAIRMVGVLVAGFAAGAAGAPPAPDLETDRSEATAGYYRLEWAGDAAREPVYTVQEAADAGFSAPRTIYRGPGEATVLSGRPDGERFYRVRARYADAGTTPWSEPVRVRVEHHSLGRAFAFFGVGAVVFLSTLGLIVAGGVRERHEEAG